MSTINTISSALQTALSEGKLTLTPQTLSDFPLGDVFSLLQTESLNFEEATVTGLDNAVALSGKAALLGTAQVSLTLMFTQEDGPLTFDFKAQLPTGLLPGAPWLSLEAMEIALQIVGQGNSVTGNFSGTIRSGEVELDTQIQVTRADGSYTLDWTIAELDLGAIATLFLDGTALPEELPHIAFADIAASITTGIGAFSLSAASAGAWEFPANGGGLTISEANFSVERTVDGAGPEATSQINAAVSISGSEPIAIATDFSLSSFSLDFELSGSDWRVQGDVAAVIFDESISLSAQYAQQEGVRTLMLSSSAPGLRDLIQLEGVGSFGVTGLTMAYSRPIAVPGEPAEPAEWSLSASGRMMVEEVFDFEGTLTLARTATETSLVFMPEAATVTLPLPPSDRATMAMAFGEISFVRRNPVGVARSIWIFEAAVGLTFDGWHPDVQARLPEAINATFRATNDSVRVTADRVLAPFDFNIPDIEIDDDLSISLGAARIDVTDLAVILGQSIELSARIGVGLPADLNNLFGVNDGQPALELFNTFDPANPTDTTIETELSISVSGGIRVIPRSSILKAIEVTEENGITFWDLDLGEFGAVKFQVPVFGYNAATSSFQTSGGFEVVRPLSIPLTPAKLLLEAVGLGAIANGIPDGIPMEPIKILDDEGNFHTEALVALLEQVTDGEFPDGLGDVLNVIGDQLERLPASFREYLNVEIPDSFSFELAVTPTGEIRLDAHVNEGDPPVRLLYPSFTPVPLPLPALNGVELRSLSFGTLTGGSLFLLQVDADLDQFDLLTLGGSLLIPDIDALPLPDTRDLRRRLELHNLFMIVVYQTGIPIPIPLFYDKLGLDYLGLEGLNLETNIQFPQPSLNLAEVGEVLSKLKRFFTDRDYLLDPNDAPEDFNLRFTFPLPNNFLKLPEYLGSERLGSDDTGIEIDAYRNLAHLLNGFKTFSLNELIQSVPLEHRVNSADVSFGPLSMGAGWLVTTPGEFQQIAGVAADRQRVYDRLGFSSDEEARDVFAIAPLPPASAPTPEEGLVALLRGTWGIANVAQFDAAFGLAASGSQGFSTGFRIAGDITNVLDMEVAGLVAINTPSATNPGQTDAFRLAGHTHLSLLNHQIFDGDVQILNDTFQIRGNLSLFPTNSPLQVNGQWDGVISPSSVAFNGDVTASLVGFDLVGTRAILNNQRLFLQGTWLGVTTTLDVTARDQAVVLQGDVDINLWGLQADLSVNIDTAQGARVQGEVQGINVLNGAFRLSGTNGRPNPSVSLQVGPGLPLMASLSGAVSLLGFTSATDLSVSENQFSFQTSGNVFNRFRCNVSASGRQLNSAADFRISGRFEDDLFTFVNREATRVIERAVNDATAELRAAERDVQAARNEVNRLQGVVNQQRAIVRGERDDATRGLRDAQNAVTSAQNRVNDLNRQISDRQADLNRESNRQSCRTVLGRRICVPTPNPVRISQLSAEIAGLGTALVTARGALEVAQATLRGIQSGINNTPIDLDPRVAGPLAAMATANAGLTVAQASLRASQTAVGAFGDISTFITRNGIGSVLDVRSASFDLALSAASSSRIQLGFTLVYLGQSRSLTMAFDFNNPLASAEALARELLPKA